MGRLGRLGSLLRGGFQPTVILMLLGYAIDGIEPCADLGLVRIAKERIERATDHYHLSAPVHLT